MDRFHSCTCCPDCHTRISKLQMVVNQLYCYLSDFVPEQCAQVIRNEINSNNSTTLNEKPKFINHDEQASKRRSFSFQQKKQLVKKVEQAYCNGSKIKQACNKLGIAQRLYRRWRKELIEQEQQIDNYEL